MNAFNQQWEKWFPEQEPVSPQPPKRGGHQGINYLYIFGLVVLLFVIISMLKTVYADWLWFKSLGYETVYMTVLQARVLVFICTALIFGIFFAGNLLLAQRLASGQSAVSGGDARRGITLIAAVIGLILGLIAQGSWMTVLQFFNGQPFNITDPVFNKEVSFYVFTLPFMELIRGWLMTVIVITFAGCAVIYALRYMTKSRIKLDPGRPVWIHCGVLLAMILVLVGWSYWLGIWELVFSRSGAIYGASYADMHASLPAQWILIAVVAVCIALLIYAIIKGRIRLALYGIGGWVVISVVVGSIFPAMLQRFYVQPNELALEKQYIEYNIEFTRDAYGLNRIEEQPFPAEDSPALRDIQENQLTIENIRLWDHRPLKDTYNQIQSIRLYYDFYDIDVDRYVIAGKYRQVMLSARELSAEKFAGQAQTWVNRQLQFTHGYGIVVSPVNETTGEGLPSLLVKDIPPVGQLKVERPQIYFGEKTNHHVIVKTNTQEFDYPAGDSNVYGRWEGENGINVGGLFNRFLFAWELGDFNLLISNELISESELLYKRNIRERVRTLAPFLSLDGDPYIVLNDGKLVWIQDCYTTTDRYPYSEPYRGINYIRNSVKAVIDAYDGSVTFYIADRADALIQTYSAIFPKLFVPLEQMPDSLKSHLRYPEEMFTIQSSMYLAYHMRDARVFYNKEDLWAVPKEIYAGSEQPVAPYYVIMKLPGESSEEFLLMLPFTPVNKNNTIGWMAARCDGDNYGKLLAYYFPKERLVYGPSQIENRIQQDTVITEQLALWSRGGSRVIRGNLLMIPIGKSNLYVEPVFLQAEAGGLPELKRIILSSGERIVMKPTLAECIDAIFGSGASTITTPGIEGGKPPVTVKPGVADGDEGVKATGEIANLIRDAQKHYDAAQQYLRSGDWTGYGRELDALKTILNRLAELSSADGE